MTDRTDESHLDDPSDSPSDRDPFEYPADGDSGAVDELEPSEAGPRRPDEIETTEPDRPEGLFGRIRWFFTGDIGSWVYLRDVLTSIVIVVAIGVLLFAASGVWPPMVAVESGSMEPNMERGDLIFIMDNERLVPDGAVNSGGETTGIVPANVAERYDRTKFGGHGDVIVFHPNGNDGRTPIIHRAMFWVEEGENWHDRADPDAIDNAEDCEALNHCPAPHDGFITKGDNELTNRNYDQASRLSAPVRPEWIVGTAEIRVPYLGYVRLRLSGVMVQPVSLDPASEPQNPQAVN